MKVGQTPEVVKRRRKTAVPQEFRQALIPVARRVFWWGKPEEWLEDATRFTAQVMIYGTWEDTNLTISLLGDLMFQRVLREPPSGVFDPKSWAYWHARFRMPEPPLPKRVL